MEMARLAELITHAMTVDVEDYFQVSAFEQIVDRARWDDMERRVERNTHQLLDAFDADPLYRRLCKNQECFRARLTPKPFRCRLSAPPNRYPRASGTEQEQFENWDAKYRETVENFSTCRFVETIGDSACESSLQGLIELHDTLSKATSNDPLA